MLVSPNLAIAAFVAILFVSAFVAWKMKSYGDYDKTSFHTFIAILGGLGVIVTFMFYYNVVELQNQQQKIAAFQELARINDSVLNSVLEEIQQSSVYIPNFVLALTPLTNTACCDSPGCISPDISVSDPITPQNCSIKMTLSYRIFSLWQDYIISIRYTRAEQLAYISNFLQRANSSSLYEQWKVSKLNFTNKTQQFGDLLFTYALPITVQTPQSYTNAAEKLISDPAYLTLTK